MARCFRCADAPALLWFHFGWHICRDPILEIIFHVKTSFASCVS
jgi:hypothetical protein